MECISSFNLPTNVFVCFVVCTICFLRFIPNHNKTSSPYGYITGMPTKEKKNCISKTLAVKRHAKTVQSFKARQKIRKPRRRETIV